MRKLVLSIAMLSFYFIGIGQDLPEVVPPSPTVSNLMKFEEIPIDYYSGQPNISIPLFGKSLTGNLGVNLSLNYSTTGVLIDSKSGWTGTGWSLFAGGSISRTVRDIPDEAVKGAPGFTIKTGVLHNNDYWNYDNLSFEDKNKYKWKALGSKIDKYDNQLDLYQFNFMGYSGRFVILKQNNQLIPKLISRNTAFDISITHDTTYKINSFTLKDANGNSFLFDVIEETDSSSSYESIRQEANIANPGTSSSFKIRSSWHLKQVKDFNGTLLATFNYSAPISETHLGAPVRTQNNILSVQGGNYNLIKNNSYNVGVLKPKNEISQSDNTTLSRKLSSIVFRDGTRVELTTTNGHPELNNTGVKLSTIILKKTNGAELKRYNLTYETVANRLWLTKITETASGTSLETSLSYHNKASLPKFGEGYIKADAWGYFSGIGEKHSLTAFFREDQIATGLLSKIIYPTGGVKEFSFENNAYSYIGNTALTYEEYMKNPKNVTYTNAWAYNYVYTNPSTNFRIIKNGATPFAFTLAFRQDVYVSSYVDFSNSNTNFINEHVIHVQDTSGKVYAVVDLNKQDVVVNLPAGTYNLVFATKDTDFSTSYSIKANYKVQYAEESSNSRKEMIGGGPRIKQVLFKDHVNSDPARMISYIYNDITDSKKSSGVIDGYKDTFERSHEVNIDHYLFSDTDFLSDKFNSKRVRYRITTKGFNVQMSQGNYITYKDVKVANTAFNNISNTDINGYTLYKYTTASNFPTPGESLILFPKAAPRPNIDYKRGKLLSQKVYDASNRIVKEVIHTNEYLEEFLYKERVPYKNDDCSWNQFYNQYSFYKNRTIEQDLMPRCGGGGIGMIPCLSESQMGNCGILPELFTDFNLGWARVKESVTKDYFYVGASTTPKIYETKQKYTYSANNYLPITQSTINSKGETIIAQTKFAHDLNDQTLINAHRIVEPIEVETTKKVGAVTTKLSKQKTLYKDFGNGLYLPQKVQTSKGLQNLEDRIVYHSYDTKGNPKEVSKANGTKIYYVWGYQSTQPIAKIEGYTNITTAQLSAINAAISESNKDKDTATENALRSKLTLLRNAFSTTAQVTTFTYDPLIGVTSITDPRGYVMYYQYDSFNRLEFIKDASGNIVQENKYKYKN